MINILCLLGSLPLPLDFSYVTQLSKIIKGIYSIGSGGVTQKNISRQTKEEGYSYRSIQRFFSFSINWDVLYLSCIAYFFSDSPSTVYLLAIDEVVEKKSGKSTEGVGRFFSSIAGRSIRSVCFHVLSLVEVKSRKSFVLTSEQRHGIKNKKEDSNGQKDIRLKRQVGRPKGSKNKNKEKAYSGLSRSYERLVILGLSLLSGIGIVPNYIVADGAYGYKTYVLIAIEQQLSIISKLRQTSVLYLPANVPEKKRRGRRRKYGKKVILDNLSPNSRFFHKTIEEENSNLVIDVYHFPKIWVKFLPVQITVVVLMATHKETGKKSRRILFSNDLLISPDLIIEYYSLRFQIEFNFRDAKQYFGLADFRAYKPKQVKNSVGLAFFMVNFSHIVRKKVMELWDIECLSILDLKAGFRAEKHLERILKLLDIDPMTIKNQIDIQHLASFDAINLS